MNDTRHNESGEPDGSYTDEEQKDGTRTLGHGEHHADEADGKYTDTEDAETAAETLDPQP